MGAGSGERNGSMCPPKQNGVGPAGPATRNVRIHNAYSVEPDVPQAGNLVRRRSQPLILGYPTMSTEFVVPQRWLGRCGRPEDRLQAIEKIDSAPGIAVVRAASGGPARSKRASRRGAFGRPSVEGEVLARPAAKRGARKCRRKPLKTWNPRPGSSVLPKPRPEMPDAGFKARLSGAEAAEVRSRSSLWPVPTTPARRCAPALYSLCSYRLE